MDMPVLSGNDFGKKELSDLPEKNLLSLSIVSVAVAGKVLLMDFTFRSADISAFRLM